MAVNTIIAGVSSGAVYAAEFNKVASALNTCGQYSHNASVALTTTPTAIPFSVNDTQFGNINHNVSINTTRFNVSADGDYVFIVQPQVSHLTTGTGNATFWLRKNGTTPISNSGAVYQMGGIVGTDVLVITSVIPLIANDYIEVMADRKSVV